MIYLVDTTLGLILAIWGLKAIDWLANEYDWVSLKHSGVYEGVDGCLHWIHQAVAWLVILTVVKVVIFFFMLWSSEWLGVVGNALFSPLQANIRFELLFVMIFFPGILNVIYFWVADHFLKAGSEHAGAHEEETLGSEMEEKKEGLLKDDVPKESPGLFARIYMGQWSPGTTTAVVEACASTVTAHNDDNPQQQQPSKPSSPDMVVV
jgi:STIMATE family